MSDIKLSPTLMANIQSAIVEVDAEAEDAGVTLQYLAAMIGYFLGTQNMPQQAKIDYLGHLNEFSRQVLDDVSQPPAAPPARDSFGIWEPPK